MTITICGDKLELGWKAAEKGAEFLQSALAENAEVSVIFATGASQFEMLDSLVACQGIDWSRVTAFHLDEYIGLDATHPASFRNYLNQRLVARLPTLKRFVPIDATAADIEVELARLNALIREREIDVCFAGIGENCHLAFNDPPANFETDDPYIVVALDDASRSQQHGEGWFPSFEAVPTHAISMSVKQIFKSKTIVLSIPDQRKAQAVKDFVEGPVSNLHPASVLQQHPNCHVFLDRLSASLLSHQDI